MSKIVKRFEALERRVAELEREAAIVVRTIEIGGPVETLRNVRAEVAGVERGEALLTMGGVVAVTELGSARVEEFVVPGGEGVSAVVFRKCRGGDVQSTEVEPFEFESYTDAIHFLDLAQDTRLRLVGAAGGEDVEVELAQVRDVAFVAADEAAGVAA